MARNCNCAGSTCGCKIIAGTGISILGIGTAAEPFQIVNTGAQLASALAVTDTSTLNLTLAGSGTNVDPSVISGVVTLKMQQLTDVSNPAGNPLAGQAPVYIGTSGTDGHWEFRTTPGAIPYRSGLYYPAGRGVVTSAGASSGNGVFRAVPVYIPTPTVISTMGGEVTVVGEAGSVIRFGIYADSNGVPGTLVKDFGTISGTAVAAFAEVTNPTTLAPGWYWFGAAVQLAPTTQPTIRLIVPTDSSMGDMPVTVGTAPLSNQAIQIGYLMTGATGALPATFAGAGAPPVTASAPRVLFKVG